MVRTELETAKRTRMKLLNSIKNSIYNFGFKKSTTLILCFTMLISLFLESIWWLIGFYLIFTIFFQED